jgi:hypothetical protein
MNEVIEFLEIDGGPSGIWWEAETLDGYRAFDTTDDMLAVAAECRRLGYPVRFRTQAEYQLMIAIEED